jgi:hypothetical protein
MMKTENEEFTKEIRIKAAFDKRHHDQKKNYGIHGMELCFYLIGSKGAAQFIYYTPMHLKHVQQELWIRNTDKSYNPFKGMAADIGYHSPHPMYEGQSPMAGKCDLIGCQCYYDGSTLQASEFEDEFLAGGSEAVWKMLTERYHDWFGDES